MGIFNKNICKSLAILRIDFSAQWAYNIDTTKGKYSQIKKERKKNENFNK
jgi:VCBS repeat-containing protein